MKNIKKFLVVAFAFLALFTFTGCETKYQKSRIKPEEALAKSEEAAKKVDNYKMTVDMKISFSVVYQGVSVDMDIASKLEGINDLKNKTAYMKVSAEALGQKEASEMYIEYDETNHTATSYTQILGLWKKAVESYNDGTENSMLSLQENLKEGYDIKEIDADKDNYNYEITIKGDALNEILSNANSVDTTEELLSSIKDGIKLQYSLDKDTYQITRIYMDLTDAIKSQNVEGVD